MITKIIDLKGTWETHEVWLNGKKLSPTRSQSVRDHSQEFSWGYPGSGPAALALAICLELTSITFEERKFSGYPYNYQDFKFAYIATLPTGDFDIKGMQVIIKRYDE